MLKGVIELGLLLCPMSNTKRNTYVWMGCQLSYRLSFPISADQVQGVPSRAWFAHQWKGLAFLAPRARGESPTRFPAAGGKIRQFRCPFREDISLWLCLHYSNIVPTAVVIQLCRYVRHPSDTGYFYRPYPDSGRGGLYLQ